MDATYKDEGDIQVMVERFERCEIKLEEFAHASHLTVAAWYLIHFDVCEALVHTRAGLQRFIAHHGRQRYHETITRFWMELIGNYLNEVSEDVSLIDRVNRVITRFGSKDILFEYYTRERVMSVTAKSEWVEPDVKPLSTKNTVTSQG